MTSEEAKTKILFCVVPMRLKPEHMLCLPEFLKPELGGRTAFRVWNQQLSRDLQAWLTSRVLMLRK